MITITIIVNCECNDIMVTEVLQTCHYEQISQFIFNQKSTL